MDEGTVGAACRGESVQTQGRGRIQNPESFFASFQKPNASFVFVKDAGFASIVVNHVDVMNRVRIFGDFHLALADESFCARDCGLVHFSFFVGVIAN